MGAEVEISDDLVLISGVTVGNEAAVETTVVTEVLEVSEVVLSEG